MPTTYDPNAALGDPSQIPAFVLPSAAELGQQQGQYLQTALASYPGMGNIMSDLSGTIAPDVLSNIYQSAGERGVMTGQGVGPNVNAAALRAVGLTSDQLRARGLSEYNAATSTIPQLNPLGLSQQGLSAWQTQVSEAGANQRAQQANQLQLTLESMRETSQMSLQQVQQAGQMAIAQLQAATSLSIEERRAAADQVIERMREASAQQLQAGNIAAAQQLESTRQQAENYRAQLQQQTASAAQQAQAAQNAATNAAIQQMLQRYGAGGPTGGTGQAGAWSGTTTATGGGFTSPIAGAQEDWFNEFPEGSYTTTGPDTGQQGDLSLGFELMGAQEAGYTPEEMAYYFGDQVGF
jgi:hypothetical protein